MLARTLFVGQAQAFIHQGEIKAGALGVSNRVCQILHDCEN